MCATPEPKRSVIIRPYSKHGFFFHFLLVDHFHFLIHSATRKSFVIVSSSCIFHDVAALLLILLFFEAFVLISPINTIYYWVIILLRFYVIATLSSITSNFRATIYFFSPLLTLYLSLKRPSFLCCAICWCSEVEWDPVEHPLPLHSVECI